VLSLSACLVRERDAVLIVAVYVRDQLTEPALSLSSLIPLSSIDMTVIFGTVSPDEKFSVETALAGNLVRAVQGWYVGDTDLRAVAVGGTLGWLVVAVVVPPSPP
jgi:hypothetical protein